MSQDTHLFSVRRPRETLGGISHNAFSGIPQPPSAMKRSNSSSHLKEPATAGGQHGRSQSSSRLSLAPSMRPPQPTFARATSSTGQHNGGADPSRSAGPLQRSSSNGALHRMSYALQTPARAPNALLGASSMGQSTMQRRSSVYSRPSTSGPMAMGAGAAGSAWGGAGGAGVAMAHQSFFSQAPLAAGQPADRRRLRDRGVLLQLAGELEEYLAAHNFQTDMKHALRADTLRNPTQKDFTLLFQWLYRRIDPAYVFQKSMDAEVPPILKQLRYPYEKSITKSALMAVGGQNWSTFLGMLHWLMQLAIMMERFAEERYDHACAEEGVDVSSDRIMFHFLRDAYATWLSSPPGEDGEEEDDEAKLLEPHIAAMAAEFEHGNEECAQQLRALEEEHAALEKQIAEAEAELPDLDKLSGYVSTLESDLKKFEAWETNVQAKLKKNEVRNDGLRAEIQEWEQSLEAASRERAELQAAVDAQGITVAEIDRLNSERERLQTGVEGARARLDDVTTRAKERETEAGERLVALEGQAREFNAFCYDVGMREAEFELVVQTRDVSFGASQQGGATGGGDRLLADGETGYDPRRILNLDMRGRVKSHVTGIKKAIGKRRSDARDRDEENKRLMFEVTHAIDDKRMEVEALDHKVRIAREEYEKTRDNANTNKLSSDAQIERAEKEMAKMRAEFTEDVQLMEQRELNTQFQYEQLTARGNAIREDMHTKIDDVLNLICKFKMHVQDNLAAYENMVEDEVVDHEHQVAAMAAKVAKKLEYEGREEAKVEDEGDIDMMQQD